MIKLFKTAARLVFVICLMIPLSIGIFTVTSYAADEPIIIRLGHNTAPDSPNQHASLKFAELVSKGTDNQIQVKVYPAQQLGNGTAQMKNVRMGTQEMFMDVGSKGSALVPDFMALIVPFLVKDQEHARKVYSGPVYNELADKLLKKFGVRVLCANMDRAEREMLTKRPVSKLSDLKGLKLRTPGNPIFVKSWNALGASVTPMAFQEVYLGLQQGAIDGIENPFDLIYTQKFYEAAKECTLTNHLYEKGALFINDKFFQGLTKKQQEVIQKAAVEAGEYHNKVLWDQIEKAKEVMKKAGVNFIEFPDSEREKAIQITAKVAREFEESGKWPKGLSSKILNAK